MNYLQEPYNEQYAVIVPTYNEADNIIPLALRLATLEVPYLFVDDGSTDETYKKLKDNSIWALSYAPNKGKGLAVTAGAEMLKVIGYDWALVLDGDNQFGEQQIEKFDNFLFWNAEKCDLIIGNRFEGNTNMPLLRKITNKVLSWIISKIAGVKIPDTQCGFRMIKISRLHELDLKCNRFDFETEMLIKAAWKDWRIKSVGVDCRYFKDRKSRIKIGKDTWRLFKLLAKLSIRKLFGRTNN